MTKNKSVNKSIILIGKPGAGKGTFAKKMEKEQGYYHLGGSDLLRENSMDESAKYYKEARHALSTGILVSDEIINGMFHEKMKSLKGRDIVFDGFPRSIEQAKAILSYYPNSEGLKAIYLDVPDEELVHRIVSRITCSKCSASYSSDHVKNAFSPSVEGVCDECGGDLIKRVDDNEETLKTRLEQYSLHTAPLIDFFKKHMDFETI